MFITLLTHLVSLPMHLALLLQSKRELQKKKIFPFPAISN